MRKTATPQSASESLYDKRTALVRDMVEKENAKLDARTARLRALRLAQEASALAAKAKPKPKARVKKAR
jgi:hypothetical protein